MPVHEYRIILEQLSQEDGGGSLAQVLQLPGCMSDAETPEEAAHNVQDAIAAWIEEARAIGREVPAPARHAA
ncbi:type II toxin-antitoxin system HicB family antitoxin [Microvirga sp. M2]|uniref:type II toxin-antitoxin system HicB family antitoxin n=1 Tax=Microvirga sp. M2 TaxID=3073270 RepID=UPI0039C4CA40